MEGPGIPPVSDPAPLSQAGTDRVSGGSDIVLVVPHGAIHPRTGGGQRSIVLFEALKTLGPVSVIIVAEHVLGEGAAEFFPGARNVRTFVSGKVLPPPRNVVLRKLKALLKLLNPVGTYAPEAGLRQEILAELPQSDSPTHPKARIVAFRYIRTFSVAGLRDDPDNRLFTLVDVDDRDDVKGLIQLAGSAGSLRAKLVDLLIIRRVRNVLLRVLSNASRIFLTKPEDRFSELAIPQAVIENVPFIAPKAETLSSAAQTGEVLVFVGSSGHGPNVGGLKWFLARCWPRILAARGTARLRIMGLGDWPSILSAEAGQPGIDVIGEVADLAPEYAQARAAICPIQQGAGSQIKIIEACSHARATIATDFSAGGFGKDLRAALPSASSAEAFADLCIRFLSDPGLAETTGAQLKQLQQDQFSRAAMQRRIAAEVTEMIGLASAEVQPPQRHDPDFSGSMVPGDGHRPDPTTLPR